MMPRWWRYWYNIPGFFQIFYQLTLLQTTVDKWHFLNENVRLSTEFTRSITIWGCWWYVNIGLGLDDRLTSNRPLVAASQSNVDQVLTYRWVYRKRFNLFLSLYYIAQTKIIQLICFGSTVPVWFTHNIMINWQLCQHKYHVLSLEKEQIS